MALRSSVHRAARGTLGVVALGALFVAAPAGAEERGLAGYVGERWTTESGLPQNSVNAIAQTPDGHLWIATFGGLARFDGVRFRVFDVGSEPPLPSSRITALHVARDGRLWIGTEDAGAVVLAGERVEQPPAGPLRVGTVWSFAESADGTIWVGGAAGVERIAPGGRSDHFLPADGLPSPWARALAIGRDGTLWVGTDAGSARFAGGRFVAVATPPVWSFARAAAGADALVAAGERGLFTLDAAGHPALVLDSAELAPRAVLVDRAGAIWTGGEQLARRAPGGGAPEVDRELRFGRTVKTLFEDREGGVWLGTESYGLIQLRVRRAHSFGRAAGLPGASALPIFEDAQGRLWVGTLCGGLAKFENGRFESQPPFGGKGFDCVSALAPARDGGLWVGARGVAKLGGTEPRPEITAAVGDGLVHALYESADGALWIALDRGLERFAEGRLAPVAGLEGEEAFALVELGPARLGIGLHGALAIVEDGVARKLDLFESVRAAVPIRDLWPAPDGALWAASYGAGLLRIGADGRVARVGSAQGLAENFVSRILPDGRGHLWLTGNRGIHRVALAELEAAVADGSARVVPLSLGVRDGLEVAETNGGGQPAGWLRGDGSLVVPTVRGIAIVEPDPPGRAPPRATVAFEEIRLSGDRVAPAGALALPARRDRRLEVHFTAPSFAQPEEVRFRYRLAGIDEEWQLDRGARTATYTHLPPGDYRFEVEALGEDETRPLSTASFALAVEPLFVETWAFRALAGAALAALVLAWHRLRLLRLRRRGAELERLVAARTREIGALNRDLERRVGEQTVEIRDTRDLAILTLARLAELRDGTTGEHLDRIARFSRRLAEALARGPFGELDEEFIDELYRSSPLHDIGKVAIPDAILCKPGPLDEREREIMKSHTTIGGDTLRAVVGHGLRRGFLDMAAEIAYSHHERWDGGGYPRGLAGTATPLVARIVAVVDAYDAITSPRPYKPSHPHEEALRRIVSDRGSHFDPQLVDAFVGIQAEIDRIRREHASAAA